MKNRTGLKIFIVGLMVLFILPGAAVAEAPRSSALGTAFTYQGRLTDGGAPAEGTYDLSFILYDAITGGSQVGSTITKADVLVNEGYFTVQLDFGAVFDGSLRYLEISVRPSGSDAGYAVLSPRQALTAAPNAIYAASAPWSGIMGKPADFADGTDNDTTYTAGDGLALVGTQFSVTGAPWSGITGMPAGFADGTDNDTTYTAGDGLALDGTQFKGKGTSYQNMIIVAKSGGDFTSIQAALDSIIDASDGNRYLVYVAPGVYNEQVTMEPFVDIEGAGELTTMITFTGSESYETGTVNGANDAELRFLTVENTGGNTHAIAIYNDEASLRLTHITVSASGGQYYYGVNNNHSSPTMTSVTASASGVSSSYAVYNCYSSPTMTNVTASALGGSHSCGVYNYDSSTMMTDVTANASEGTLENEGVKNEYSSPIMTNVTASASGGAYSDGVYNKLSSVTMTDVIASGSASGSGLTFSYGVENYASSATMTNVTASGSGGTNNYGVYNYAYSGSYTVEVNNSQITGSTNTIVSDSEVIVKIGASQLSGGAISGSGTITCIGVYDENFTSPGYDLCP